MSLLSGFCNGPVNARPKCDDCTDPRCTCPTCHQEENR